MPYMIYSKDKDFIVKVDEIPTVDFVGTVVWSVYTGTLVGDVHEWDVRVFEEIPEKTVKAMLKGFSAFTPSLVREKEFRSAFEKLLKEHDAEFTITDDGRNYGLHLPVVEISMQAQYNANNDLLEEFTSFYL